MSLSIDQAFVSSFIAAEFGLPIAHENVSYDPVPGEPYAELLNLPNSVEPFTVADINETSGLFRIILRYPTGQGSIAVKQKAEEIMAFYGIGTNVTYNGQSATITAVQRQAGHPEDAIYKLVITIRYQAYLAR